LRTFFARAGFAVFGPNAAAAQLEGSKGFTKDLCTANGIPTAGYVRVETVAAARDALKQFSIPVVIKADGLAAGKGVTVAMSRGEAEAAIDAAGDGLWSLRSSWKAREASLFALVDGETAVALASAQDHKRVGEGDTGPNTGGMGAYSPAPVLTPDLERQAMDEIVRPTVQALAEAGTPFSGVLYAGLMLTGEGPKLIEYNVRFGDPECEAIMPRVEGDFAELLHAVATGRLDQVKIKLSPHHAVTVIVAAHGYPDTPKGGGLIREIEAAEQIPGVTVFHAGTERSGESLVAKGGRVLAVTAVATPSPMPGPAPIAPSTRSILPTVSIARISAGASWSALARSPINEPALGPLLAGNRGGRRRRRDRGRLRLPAQEARTLLACGRHRGKPPARLDLAWTDRTAERYVTSVERQTRHVLVDWEMPSVRAVVARDPVKRTLILSGPADDFQRAELVRILNYVPGVGNVRWANSPEAFTLPLLVETELAALISFGIGLVLAYLLELRRRSRAQWSW
jgi:phosphoribosylamine--glycine ligase